MTHTAGPWTYVRNPEDTRWIIDRAPNEAIACTAGYEPDNEANARLIAAAPELLGALVAMLEHYVSLAGCGDCGHWNPEEEAIVIATRALLAKARGDA